MQSAELAGHPDDGRSPDFEVEVRRASRNGALEQFFYRDVHVAAMPSRSPILYRCLKQSA
jgi:hypothetical protein